MNYAQAFLFLPCVWTVMTYGFSISPQITQKASLEGRLEINRQPGFQMTRRMTIDFLRGRANGFTKWILYVIQADASMSVSFNRKDQNIAFLLGNAHIWEAILLQGISLALLFHFSQSPSFVLRKAPLCAAASADRVLHSFVHLMLPAPHPRLHPFSISHSSPFTNVVSKSALSFSSVRQEICLLLGHANKKGWMACGFWALCLPLPGCAI